jgi:hypothetical protein
MKAGPLFSIARASSGGSAASSKLNEPRSSAALDADGDSVKIVLAAVDQPLADAWRRFCSDLEGVRVHEGSILEVCCDSLVTPASSLGFLEGGIDALYYRIRNLQRD